MRNDSWITLKNRSGSTLTIRLGAIAGYFEDGEDGDISLCFVGGSGWGDGFIMHQDENERFLDAMKGQTKKGDELFIDWVKSLEGDEIYGLTSEERQRIKYLKDEGKF